MPRLERQKQEIKPACNVNYGGSSMGVYCCVWRGIHNIDGSANFKWICNFVGFVYWFETVVWRGNKEKKTTEKHLMIDIHAARQSYSRYEFDFIGLANGPDNPTDNL